MVEAANEKKVQEEITHNKEKQVKHIAKFEELKTKVNPKIALIQKELADLEEIFKTFQDNNEEEDGKNIFAKTLDYHLDGLKFNPHRVVNGLDEEISLVRRELQVASLFSFEEIKNLKAQGPYKRSEPNGLLTQDSTLKLCQQITEKAYDGFRSRREELTAERLNFMQQKKQIEYNQVIKK